jgi:general secretion pathway protein N
MKSIRFGRRGARAVPTSVFGDSVLGTRAPRAAAASRASVRFGLLGAVLGLLGGTVVFAPAAWLASAIEQGTGGRLLLADAQGTVWEGSAALLLTGGRGSRDAAALPGRIQWNVGLRGAALAVGLRQACCLDGEFSILVRPGLGRIEVSLPPRPAGFGQWPAAWLAGLGTPWNTLQLGGVMRLSTSGAKVEIVQGRWRLEGALAADLVGLSSRVSTLETLGSYRLQLQGGATGGATLLLNTTDGALRLSGSGQWAGPTLRFQGEAVAAQGSEQALDNLLNILGRRDGARSLIVIG